jgi:hypothetical protein
LEGWTMLKLDECYQALGIDPGATLEDVEEAYGQLAKVWSPERFPNDDHIRRMAEEKMTEIDAARDALLDFLLSEENAGARGGINRRAMSLEWTCDNPRCTGALDKNGICYECGKLSALNSFRYTVGCSACGTRNVVASKRDYDRGICVGCGMRLGVPVRIEQKSSRKAAYLVLLVVIFALGWYFFSSEKPRDRTPKKYPLNSLTSQSLNGIPTEKAVGAQVPPRAEPEARQVQSAPAPLDSPLPPDKLTTSGHLIENTGEVPPTPTPSENASDGKIVPVEETNEIPTKENTGHQPVEQAGLNFNAEGKDSGVVPFEEMRGMPAEENNGRQPVEKVGRISDDARQDAAPVEVRPGSSDQRGKENYDRLIDEVVKKKAARPHGKTGELRDLPFEKLNK